MPNPPLLVPELVGGAADETTPVRDACVAAATWLTEVTRNWIAVATDPLGPRTFGTDSCGTFAGFGVDIPVALSSSTVPTGADGAVDLPLPALVAGWLRAESGADEVRMELVSPTTSRDDCRSLGRRLAAEATGLLVLGDGSARHGDHAPGDRDDRAGDFDESVRLALAAGDPAALLQLDINLATELIATGRPAWQVLAGAAEGRAVDAMLLYSAAPFGVAYHVAGWDFRVGERTHGHSASSPQAGRSGR